MYPDSKEYETLKARLSWFEVLGIERLTNRGTSLLIISWTLSLRLELLEKLTRYLRENVKVTCWFIAMSTPPEYSSSSFFVLAFFAGFLLCK